MPESYQRSTPGLLTVYNGHKSPLVTTVDCLHSPKLQLSSTSVYDGKGTRYCSTTAIIPQPPPYHQHYRLSLIHI